MNQPLATGVVTGNPVIDLERVNVTFGGEKNKTVALAETSLRIENGEFVALVGPSGC